jgi:uncharacterized membrane protein
MSIMCTQVTASMLLGYVFMQAVLLPTYNVRSYETWLIAVVGTLAILISFHEISDHNWEAHVTSVTMLLAWTELMFLIGRFPRWGNYALMFYTVLQNVLRVLLAFVCIVIGFALSFFVQFGRNGHSPLFGDPWKAFVKTMVMMTGEYEYKDIFEGNVTDLEAHRNGSTRGDVSDTKCYVTAKVHNLVTTVSRIHCKKLCVK